MSEELVCGEWESSSAESPVLYEAASGYCGTLLELVYELRLGLVCRVVTTGAL